MKNKTLIFGHRGYPQKFPENSLAGFSYAIDHGADGLEFDVHLTKDSIPVIMHDEKINRTTNGYGRIYDYTYQELQKFNLENGENIPKLSDLLTLAQGKSIYLNLEFKTNTIQYLHIEEIVLNLVKQYNLTYPVIYSSFNLQSLKNAYQIDPDQQYCFLSDKILKNPQELVMDNHLAGLHLNHYQPLRKIKERIWTIDDIASIRTLLTQHVAGIITNNFELAKNVQNSMLAV